MFIKKLYLYGIPFERNLFSPLLLFLQYLPHFILEEGEAAFVSCRPEEEMKGIVIERDSFKAEEIEPWGHTEAVRQFTKRRGIPYAPPPLDLVEKLSSKITSHTLFPFLNSSVVTSPSEIARHSPPFLVKSPFGFSARETRLFHTLDEPKIRAFAEPYFQRGEMLLVEPWVERTLDFSSQWSFSDKGLELLGVTELLNTPRGSYLGTHLREGEKRMSWEEEHVDAIRPHLLSFWREGFRGPLGVDAFLFRHFGKVQLRPVVEINPRATMARPLLLYRKKVGDLRSLTLQFEGKGRPLFPKTVIDARGKKIACKKQLFLLD